MESPIAARRPGERLMPWIAVLLTVGFYALALAAVGLLLYSAYGLIDSDLPQRVRSRSLLVSVVASLAILRAVFPRRIPKQSEDFRIDLSAHPALQEMVEGVASATGQAVPSKVFIMPDVNAFVGQQGGWLGLGGERILGVGLPLLGSLSPKQVEGVIAHEFGHLSGDDTRFGRWIFQARSAIERSQAALEGSLLSWPFIAYGKLFLRTTSAISRRQELAADRVAADVAGPEAVAHGLQRLPALEVAYHSFFNTELLPALQAGRRPPLIEGFHRFLRHEERGAALARIETESLETPADPDASHPAIAESVEALMGSVEARPDRNEDWTGPFGTDLLSDLDQVETLLLQAMFGDATMERLEPSAWESRSEDALRGWHALLGPHLAMLQGIRPESLPLDAPRMRTIAGRWHDMPAEDLPQRRIDELAPYLHRAMLGLALFDRGWRPDMSPERDDTVLVHEDGREVPLSDLAGSLGAEDLEPSEWRERMQALELAGLDMADVIARSAKSLGVDARQAPADVASGEGAGDGGASVEASAAAEDAQAMRPHPSMAPTRWLLVLLGLGLAATGIDWLNIDGESANLRAAVEAGAPVWSVAVPVLGIAVSLLALLKIKGGGSLIALSGFALLIASIFLGPELSAWAEGADAALGRGPWAALGLILVISLVAFERSLREPVGVDARLSRFALFGRYHATQGVTSLGELKGWTLRVPRSGFSEQIADGAYRGRHCTVRSATEFGWTSTFKAMVGGERDNGYLFTIAVEVPNPEFAVYRDPDGMAAEALPEGSVALTDEHGILLIPAEGVVDPTHLERLRALVDARPLPDGMLMMSDGLLILRRFSVFALRMKPESVRETVDWMIDLADILEP